MCNTLRFQERILVIVLICFIRDAVTSKITIEVVPLSGYAQEDQPLIFTCSVTTENASIGQVTVLKNEKSVLVVTRCCVVDVKNDLNFKLNVSKIPQDVKQFSLTFSRERATKDDDGVYRCSALNNHFVLIQTNNVTIRVGSAPKDLSLQFVSGTEIINSSTLNESSKFRVICGARGSQLTLTLFKDHDVLETITGSDPLPLGSSSFNMSVQEDFNLVHGKEFRCKANNSWDTQELTQLVLIPYAPKFEGITLNGQSATKLTVQPGTKLTCESSAYPTPAVFFDATKLNSSQFRAEPNKLNEVIVLTIGERVDTSLVCFASNDVKQVEKTFLITIDSIAVINSGGSGSKPSGSLVLAVGIAIAILLLLLMAFIVITILCVRQRRQSHSKLKSNAARRNNYQPVNSAECNPGSSKVQDVVELDGSKGQAPAKPLRPPPVLADPLEEELHYSTLTFNDQPGSRQPIVSTKPNSDASLLSVRLRKGPPPGSYSLPTPVPAGRHPAFQQPHQPPPLAGPVANGYETEYSEIVGIHPYTSV